MMTKIHILESKLRNTETIQTPKIWILNGNGEPKKVGKKITLYCHIPKTYQWRCSRNENTGRAKSVKSSWTSEFPSVLGSSGWTPFSLFQQKCERSVSTEDTQNRVKNILRLWGLIEGWYTKLCDFQSYFPFLKLPKIGSRKWHLPITNLAQETS